MRFWNSNGEAERAFLKRYFGDVRETATEIVTEFRDAVKAEDLTSDEEVIQRLNEEADNAVTYTMDAHMILALSDNSNAYEDEIGEKAPTVEAAAFMAYRADVLDLLQNEYFLADLYPTEKGDL